MRIAAAFVAAFLAGGVAIFGIAHAAGVVLGAGALPDRWRVAGAGVLLLILATVDLRAMATSSYCPIGWRRQTPRSLMRRHRLTTVATLWGLDTGFIVTTFRVAALSWGALCLTLIGLSPAWTGAAYALGFLIPFLALIVGPTLRRSARDASPGDSGLERMLRLRGAVQGASALLLIASGALLLGHGLA